MVAREVVEGGAYGVELLKKVLWDCCWCCCGVFGLEE